MSELLDRAKDSLNTYEYAKSSGCDPMYPAALMRQLVDEVERLRKRSIPEMVTRVDVIDPRREEHWSDYWTVVIQDEGRTLKLFAESDGEAAKEERNTALARDISADMRKMGGRL